MSVRISVTVTALLLLTAPAAVAAPATAATLSVTGQGSVMVAPDQASLSLTVTRSAPTAQVALSHANAVTDAIVAAVQGTGVPASGIQTSSIDTSCGSVKVGPKHHKHRIRRCSADESLQITSTAAQAGAVIDAATRAGASNINGPNFGFSNPSAGLIAADSAALQDAQKQADAVAATLGYTVTGVQSVQVNPQQGIVLAPPEAPVASSGTSPSSTPTSTLPGTQQVTATVAVVFTIAPAASAS